MIALPRSTFGDTKLKLSGIKEWVQGTESTGNETYYVIMRAIVCVLILLKLQYKFTSVQKSKEKTRYNYA